MKTYHFEEELPEGKQAFDLVVEIGTGHIKANVVAGSLRVMSV